MLTITSKIDRQSQNFRIEYISTQKKKNNNKMNSSCRRKAIWKFVASVVGCVGMAFNVFLFYHLMYDNEIFNILSIKPYIYVTSAINLMASIIWFCGFCMVSASEQCKNLVDKKMHRMN